MKTDNEKYNETVQPNTAFLNELKGKTEAVNWTL